MELGKWASFAPFFSLYDIPFPELASRVNEDAALQERRVKRVKLLHRKKRRRE